jgi:uncharacterized protein (TIGR03083 family)
MSAYSTPYSGRSALFDALRTEEKRLVDLVIDPRIWASPTYIDGWTVQDVVCHLVDEAEDYLRRWEMARSCELPDAMDLATFREDLRRRALSYRQLTQDEAIARFAEAASAMTATFSGLTAEQWVGFNVAHPLFGVLPSSAFPAIQVTDYMLHYWDIRAGLGDTSITLDERSAATLIPHMFDLWRYTFDRSAAAGEPIAFGIRTDGAMGGQWKVVVADGGFSIDTVEDLAEVPVVFRYDDAAEMLLTRFQRIKAGTASGDPEAISRIRDLFSGL